jgi:hypothetical protein
MSRFTTVVVLAALAIGATAAMTATAAAKSKPNLWRNKADTVTCGVEIHASNKPASRILCDAAGVPAPPHSNPHAGDPGFVDIAATGSPQLLRLSQNSWVGTKTVTLSKGTLWSLLGVTCNVGPSTVLCFNTANHGFVIGNGKYRSF